MHDSVTQQVALGFNDDSSEDILCHTIGGTKKSDIQLFKIRHHRVDNVYVHGMVVASKKAICSLFNICFPHCKQVFGKFKQFLR